ncbi:MAG: tRNA (guanosine(46)-N7)-methyltransferase TrmB [Phascolarctobacterium sp.]|nr:tRNA (guanosine(46)-N7)-methyltransferase TrmB [Phascolarctobacterium sp.]
MRLRKKPWIDQAIRDLEGECVFMHGPEGYKGKWHEMFPGKKICVEIGSGKGRFIIGMAGLCPEKAFIGIENESGVAYYPASAVKDGNIGNLRMICANAENITDWFDAGEIEELYLNFSDPWPKVRHVKRRLTHSRFLEKYKIVLKKGGVLRFKTDNRGLFDFSLEEFKECGLKVGAISYDFHNSGYENPVWTEYEEKFSLLGEPINYCEVIF